MKRFLLFISLILVSVPSQASQSNCPYNYYGGKSPTITDKRIESSSQEICFSDFVVVYDTSRKTLLWSAEKITPEMMVGALATPRVDTFHEENALKKQYRTTLKDYSGSGYDRGHMTPAGDEPNLKSQFESFSLANMVPQNQSLNRGIWAQYEESVRSIVMTTKTELYVITGPVFSKTVSYIGNKVPVPDQVFKIVISPSDKKIVVFVAKNDSSKQTSFVSVSDIESKTGINFVPVVSSVQKIKKETIQGLNISK